MLGLLPKNLRLNNEEPRTICQGPSQYGVRITEPHIGMHVHPTRSLLCGFQAFLITDTWLPVLCTDYSPYRSPLIVCTRTTGCSLEACLTLATRKHQEEERRSVSLSPPPPLSFLSQDRRKRENLGQPSAWPRLDGLYSGIPRHMGSYPATLPRSRVPPEAASD